MEAQLQIILADLRRRLEAFYGDRLVQLILFGSQARGEARPDSDIDVLILLHGPVDVGAEIESASVVISDISLAYDVVIGCLIMDAERYAQRNDILVRTIRRDGIAITEYNRSLGIPGKPVSATVSEERC